MDKKKLCLALYSGSVDKLTAAGVIVSGAASEDMSIEIYVLFQGARAFKKDIGDDVSKLEMSENADWKEDFLASLTRLNVKSWVAFFREAKSIADVKIHICGLAGKIWHGDNIEDFIDIVDDFSGISAYIQSAQEADLHMLI